MFLLITFVIGIIIRTILLLLCLSQLLEHKILFLLALSLWLVWLLEVFCGCSYLLCKFTRLLSTEIHQRFERIYFIFAILIIYWHHIQLLLTKLHILDVGESLSTR